MNYNQISKILRDNLKVVPKQYDMHGINFNSDCHLEITDKAYLIIGNGDIGKGKQITEDYLQQTGGQL